MAVLGPKIYRFGLGDPDLICKKKIYKYLQYLNGFWGFCHDTNVGGQFALALHDQEATGLKFGDDKTATPARSSLILSNMRAGHIREAVDEMPSYHERD